MGAAPLARVAGAAVDGNLGVGEGAEGPRVEPVAFSGGCERCTDLLLADCIVRARSTVPFCCAEVLSAADPAFLSSFQRGKASS